MTAASVRGDTYDTLPLDGELLGSLVGDLVAATDVSRGKIREAIRHLRSKHDYTEPVGEGAWYFGVVEGRNNGDAE